MEKKVDNPGSNIVILIYCNVEDYCLAASRSQRKKMKSSLRFAFLLCLNSTVFSLEVV